MEKDQVKNKRVHSFECACVLLAQVIPVDGSPFINKTARPRVGIYYNGDFAISISSITYLN